MNRSSFPPKRCTCCATTHTRDAWRALPLVGTMRDAHEILELRNCACGSTLAIEVSR